MSGLQRSISPPLRVACVDDESAFAQVLVRWLQRHEIAAVHVQPAAALATLAPPDGDAFDVILLDVNMPGRTGLEFLPQLRAAGVSASIVMLTSDDTASTATAALRAGAHDYLIKSKVEGHLYEVLQRAADRCRLTRALNARAVEVKDDLETLVVGTSPHAAALRHQIRQVAATSVNVLITGESGSGKEIVARAVHRTSARAERPFVALNCGSIPDGLIDSELFGHVRGAFTGASTARAGVFVEADGGTLFLDEIGDMPLAVQARLLRTIQDGEVRAVGSDAVRKTDVRLVAATNVDLARAVAEGRFRADLLFRLNVVNLEVRPLRERLGDVPTLLGMLLRKHAPSSPPPQISGPALEHLLAYPWPGNVRELENAVLYALAMKTGDEIDVTDLPPAMRHRADGARLASGSGVIEPVGDLGPLTSIPLTEAKRAAALEFEGAYLRDLMARAQGSVSAAARMAGIDRTNFRRLLQRHGIDATEFR